MAAGLVAGGDAVDRKPHDLGLLDWADGQIAAGTLKPFIAVAPSAAQRSAGEWAGVWETYLVRGVIPWIDANLPTIESADGRTLAGLSAGGFGAYYIGLRHPELFGRVASWGGYFHPLDFVRGWNSIYGPRGFVQYQFVVPYGAERVIRTAIERFSSARCASFLAVLKRFEHDGRGMLGFPMAGWTLALDIPATGSALASLVGRAKASAPTLEAPSSHASIRSLPTLRRVPP